ncbi:MAG: hypothetical protein E7324_06710 [Clostridiales bacterium]|nr:hypothetical protein [Clostridiales bacterium]
MMQNDTSRAALKVEEAVLLPALSRSLGGHAALKSALRAAEAIGEKQVSNAVMIGNGNGTGETETAAEPVSITVPAIPCRAALHHALGR